MPNNCMSKNTYAHLALVIFFSALLAACSDSTTPPTIDNTTELAQSTEPEIEQAEQLANTETHSETATLISLIDEHYSQLTNQSKQLNETLITFTKKPSQDGLQKVIEALEKSHSLFVSAYFLDSCCRIYSPDLTNNGNEPITISTKTKLDQYPLLPGYLDAVEGYPYSGLIYSDIPITRESMEQEFQLGDPAYVSLGFHALELILNGSNLNRKASDFSPLKSTQDTSTAPAELRRTLYAILLASEIENNISILKLFWESDLKYQLQQQSPEHKKVFFEELYVLIDKELEKIQVQESALEKGDVSDGSDAHNNAEIIKLRKSLLVKLASLKDLPAGT